MKYIYGFLLWLVACTGGLLSMALAPIYLIVGSPRYWKVIVAQDRAANAAWGGMNETVSSRAGRAQIRGDRWACVLCKILDRFEKNHCQKSIELKDKQ